MAEFEKERNLPPNWVWTTVESLTQPIDKVFPEDTPDDEFIYIDISSIDNSKYRVVDAKHYLGKDAPSRARQLVFSNDILFSTVRTYLRNIALVPDAYAEAIASTGFAVLRPENGISFKFIYYYLLTDEFNTQIEPLQRGTSYPAVRDSDVRGMLLPLAPSEEQHRIVDEIEAQFSRLDSWLAVMEKLREQLPRLRASILKAAVEGRLVEQDLDDESADALLQRILDERRQKWEEDYLAELAAKGKPAPKNDTWKERYREPQPPNTEGFPELPNGWMWISIDQLADVQTGSTPLRSNSAYYNNGNIPWVTSTAVNRPYIDVASEYITELALHETNAKIFPIGTLLIAMYGEGKTRGNVSELRIEAATNQACAALVFQGTASQSKNFVKLFLQKNYHEIRSLASGGAQPNLNLSIIRNTVLPFPPLREQIQISEDADYRLAILERLEAIIAVNMKRVERMRKSTLKQAFEGRLVEQDPNDAPASDLLESIQKERKRRADKAQKPKQQRNRKVSKTQAGTKPLYNILKEAEKPLSPQQLFFDAGFAHETIDEFYMELRHLIDIEGVVRTWYEGDVVYLEVIS